MSHHDDAADAFAGTFNVLARWKRKPWYYRAWAQIKRFFSARNIHRLLTKWHLWSPWKLIPNREGVTLFLPCVVTGDVLCEPSTQKQWRVAEIVWRESWAELGYRYRVMVDCLPPTNLVWRWDDREFIANGSSVDRFANLVPLGNSIKL